MDVMMSGTDRRGAGATGTGLALGGLGEYILALQYPRHK